MQKSDDFREDKFFAALYATCHCSLRNGYFVATVIIEIDNKTIDETSKTLMDLPGLKASKKLIIQSSEKFKNPYFEPFTHFSHKFAIID